MRGAMQEKKQRLMDVAKLRFKRFGVGKTTMEEVCRDAKISKKTAYKLFNSKDELFVSVFIRETLKIRESLLQQVSDIKDPLEKIIHLLRLGVELFSSDSFVMNVLKDNDGLYAPFLKEKYHLQVEEGILDILSNILLAGTEHGKFRPLDTHAVSYFVFKLFQSFTYARTPSIEGSEKEMEELLKFILEGVLKKPSRDS